MPKDEVLSKVEQLIRLHRDGKLGGEKMPEDKKPLSTKKFIRKLFIFYITNVH